MAQTSSRWLNPGAVALLFACASFVRPVFGAPSTPLASLRPVLAPYLRTTPCMCRLRRARDALCFRLSPSRNVADLPCDSANDVENNPDAEPLAPRRLEEH